jgi:hypothetical protein
MSFAATLSVDELVRRCAAETDKFARRQPHDPQFCFELLRRAFVDGSPDAFTHVYRTYERLALNWVYSHSRFAETGESADYFARLALASFYFALRGPKFHQFSGLPQVLKYLKACVHSAIAQYLRDERPDSAVALETQNEPGYEPDLGEQAETSELWRHIVRLLPDERGRLLARCAFVLGMKPRQVVAAYPSIWASEREVTVALYRIRALLRQDPELRMRAGLVEQA